MQDTNVTDLIQPNRAQIKEHLEALFKDSTGYDDGKIEIAYTGVHVKALNNALYFDVTDIDGAVDCVVEKNSTPGVNTYVGAAIRSPDCPPFGRSSSDDYYAAPYIWADIDDQEAAEAVKENYEGLPPSIVVVTGRHPHTRAQLWWRMDEAIQDPKETKELLSGLKHAMHGDPAVVDPARVMRVGGSVAWPKKEGRVPELTSVVVPSNATKIVNSDIIRKVYPPHVIELASGERVLSDGKPRSIITGNLQIEKLLVATQEAGNWHFNMRDAVAAMIGQGWTDQQIKLATAPYSDGGTNDHDVDNLITSARRSFGKPDEGDNPLPATAIPTTAVVTDDGDVELRKLPLLYADDIEVVTDTKDFVEDILREEEFSVVYGESNCGKTFLMLDMAMHVALGMDWRDKEVDQGGVIYAALEGGQGTRNRIAAFRDKHNIKQPIPLAIIPTGVNLLDTDGDVQSLIQAIEDAHAKLGDVKLIVIDTLARAISGGDENSSTDMGRIVINGDIIRQKTGAHICFIHHSGKDAAQGARGHSSLRAAVDTEIEIGRDDKDAPSIVKIVKQREMEMVTDMGFTLESMELGVNRRGKTITSCVVVPCEPPATSSERPLTPAQTELFDGIVQTSMDHGEMRTVINDAHAIKTIKYDQLNDIMASRGWKLYHDTEATTGAEKFRNQTNSLRVALKKANKINYNDHYLWVI